MTKTAISIAALTLAIAAVSTGAFAKQNANTVTAQLNQQQLQGTPIQAMQPTDESTANPSDAPAQMTVPQATVDTPTNVVVAGPPRTSTEAFGEPDTNPQSTGTATIDTPYVAVVPAPNGQTDDSGTSSSPSGN